MIAQNESQSPYPEALEAEQSVLGSMLIESQAIDAAREILTADDFCRTHHAELFSALCGMADRGIVVDAITVQREIAALKCQIETPYFMALLDAVPSAANVVYHAQIVADAAKRKRIIIACQEAMAFARQNSASGQEAQERAAALIAVASGERQAGGTELLREPLMRVLNQAEENFERGGALTGLPTGFSIIDSMTGGLQDSDLVIVAGRPSMGKTSLALAIAIKNAEQGKRVAVFSLEMSAEQLALRLLSSAAYVSSQKLRSGQGLSKEEWESVNYWGGEFHKYLAWIDDKTSSTPSSILRECKRIRAHGGIDLIVIDYLQLISPDAGRKGENRTQEVSEIARRLKSLAREMNCPVIAMSQLSRSVENRENKRPLLSDLRESGGIESEADMVCLLYREAYYARKSEYAEQATAAIEEAEISIAKHRNGPTGMVRVGFVPQFARFEEIRDDGPAGF